MEEILISKKELLELTGISYGQLYRWKRMDIIPENWFIKKSSFTGQETYFPKEKVLERINKIVELKDEYSLEELAKFFSPNPAEVELTFEDLLVYQIISKETVDVLNNTEYIDGKLAFTDLLYLYMCDRLAQLHELSAQELLKQLSFIKEIEHKHPDELHLVAIRKKEETIWMILPFNESVILEEAARFVVKVNLVETMNELKIKLSEIRR